MQFPKSHEIKYYQLFKIYLDKKEIRKCFIKNSADFSDITEILYDLFPILKDIEYKLYWKDEDNDDIIIKCDHDWNIFRHKGIDYNYDQKLFITTYESTELNKIIHTNIICDNCDNLINGIRYKCLVCDDYDLCSNCEKIGLHKKHFMIRIIDSDQWYRIDSRQLSKFISKHITKTCKFESKQQQQHRRRRSHCEKKCPMKNEEYSLVDSLLHVFNNISTANKKSEGHNESKQTETEDNKHASTPPDCLYQKINNIIENSLQFLDPLVVHVGGDMNEAQPSNTKQCEERSNISNESTSVKKTKLNDVNCKQKNVEHANDIDTENLNSQALECTNVLKPESSKQPASNTNEVEGWTLVNAGEGANGLNSAHSNERKTSEVQNSIYPVLSSRDEFTHLNPKINEALMKLQEMGFSNNDGWLTDILLTANGNINKVLELLY